MTRALRLTTTKIAHPSYNIVSNNSSKLINIYTTIKKKIIIQFPFHLKQSMLKQLSILPTTPIAKKLTMLTRNPLEFFKETTNETEYWLQEFAYPCIYLLNYRLRSKFLLERKLVVQEKQCSSRSWSLVVDVVIKSSVTRPSH